MSAIGIYSISKKLPDVSAIKFSNDVYEYDISNLLKESKTYIKKKGFGFCYAYKNKKYVITCCHIIGVNSVDIDANTEIYTIHKSNKILFKIERTIPEFDIAILKFCNDAHHNIFKYYNGTHVSPIDSIDVINVTSTRLNTFNECDVRKITMNIDCIKSSIVPPIPLVEITCDIDQEHIEGLSGSLIIQTINKKQIILGMVTSNIIDTTILEAIPMSLIKLLVCVEHEKKLSGFCFSTDFVDISDSEHNEYQYAHCISLTNNTSYSEIVDIDSESKNFTFRKHDLIVESNGKLFNNNGTVHNDDIGCDIPLDTHIMLSHYSNENNVVDMVILRDIGNKTIKINKKLVPLNIDNMYILNIFNAHKYVYWKGCVFTELSEELVRQYEDSGFPLQGDTFENYKILSSTNKTNKTIVLIHICFENIAATMPTLSENFRRIKAPLISNGDDHGLLILEKIGNKRILDLSDLVTTLNAYSHMGTNTLSYYSPSEHAIHKLVY